MEPPALLAPNTAAVASANHRPNCSSSALEAAGRPAPAGAIRGQRLLPSALSRAEIHPQQGATRGSGITTDSQTRPMCLKILVRIGRAAARDLYGRDSRKQLLHRC